MKSKTSTPQTTELKVKSVVWGAFGNGTECTGLVEDIKDTPNGIFTKYYGCVYLFKGFPDFKVVNAIAIPKKMISLLSALPLTIPLKIFYGMCLLFYLLLPKSSKRALLMYVWKYFLTVSESLIHKLMLPPQKFCESGKALYEVSEKAFQSIIDKEVFEKARRTRDLLLMAWEYDYAYRARGQDVLPFLDKEKLKKNPTKEIIRLLTIMEGRDKSCNLKWLGFKKNLPFVLKSKGIKKVAVDFLTYLDLDRIKFDEADWYYVLDRSDYLYGGLSHEERLKMSEEIDKKVGNNRPQIVIKNK